MSRIECRTTEDMCEVVAYLERFGLRFVARQAGGDGWTVEVLP